MTAPRRALSRWVILAGSSAVGVPALAIVLLIWTGGSDAAVDGLPEAGPIVHWGLPAVRALRDLSATLSVGLLVVAATLLPAGSGPVSGALGVVQRRTLHLGAASALAWSAAGMLVVVLTFAELAGSVPAGWRGLQAVGAFMAQEDLGRSLAATALLSTVAALLARTATRVVTAGWAAVLALSALLPLALTGHAAGSGDHAIAVDAQAAHLVGVSVWVGSLAALLLLGRALQASLPVVAARFSRLAAWCYGMVAASGIAGAWVRVGDSSTLASTYALLLLVKVGALLLLGAAGWAHRHRLLPHLSEPGARRAFLRLIAVELAVMAAAIGVAVALSGTPSQDVSTAPRVLGRAESLLGYPMPPALEGTAWLTQWRLDSLWLPVAVLALWWYLRSVRRLRRRGDRWPASRTISWAVSCLMLIAATNGSPGVYGSVLFSMHMVQHMTIAMAVPVFLVLGAPVTLALRATARRRDGSYGAREWLLLIVHSRLLGVLGHPIVASVLFIASLTAFYYSPLFELALRTHTGHVLMTAHFIITGYLFASVLVGVDPGPRRPPYPFRMIILMATFGFHAFFAVSLMSGTEVIGRAWFESLGRTWGRSLIEEQNLGGAMSWALGDYPIAILAFAMIYSWIRADAREAHRYDRQADRDGEAALKAYNARLEELARASEGTPRT